MEKKISWQLYYDERPQSKLMFSDSIESAVQTATKIMKKLLWEVNNKVTGIYPDEQKWELRILN
jgi:hypothetical protein